MRKKGDKKAIMSCNKQSEFNLKELPVHWHIPTINSKSKKTKGYILTIPISKSEPISGDKLQANLKEVMQDQAPNNL